MIWCFFVSFAILCFFQEPFSFRDFKKPSLYKPLFVSVMLMFFQQFSGVNAILFYTVQIFQSAAPSIDANVASVIVGVVQVAATMVAAVLMDRAGRRLLLITAGEIINQILGDITTRLWFYHGKVFLKILNFF